jgi:predicted nucleic acid-binding Zn ribbon protein
MSPWQPLPGEGSEPRPVADSLPRLVQSMGAPAPAVLTALFTRWEEIVGPAIAARAWPLRIQDGVLRIGVEQPGWATQLMFLGPDLVRKISAATGDATLEKIEVKVMPRRPK